MIKYETATVKEMHEALKKGEIKSSFLLSEAKKVISEKDKEINSFIEVFDSAEEDAENADAMIERGEITPLTGIPIAIKDNICKKGNSSTAASKILKGFVSPYDSRVVSNLKKLGAVIVGRTNMDEFAMGSSTEKSVYGPTLNPVDTERVPGGSSGGSAAAVAMGAVPLALGSDTGGSIRQPASFCGLVGLKPTYGSVSRHGLIALGSSLDAIGPLARNVEDALLLFDAIKGDTCSFDNTYGLFEDIKSEQKEKVIAIPSDLSSISKDVMDAFNSTIEGLKKKGYAVKEISLPIMWKAESIYYIIQPAEASSNLARFEGVRYGASVEGEDLWGDYIKTRTLGFGEEVMRRIVTGNYVLSAGYYDAYYKKADDARECMRSSFSEALKGVGAILMPTTPSVAFKRGEIQNPIDMYAEDRLTLQANLTGLPAISVPMKKDGLPAGVQCIGNYNSEKTLFSYAKDIEMLE